MRRHGLRAAQRRFAAEDAIARGRAQAFVKGLGTDPFWVTDLLKYKLLPAYFVQKQGREGGL